MKSEDDAICLDVVMAAHFAALLMFLNLKPVFWWLTSWINWTDLVKNNRNEQGDISHAKKWKLNWALQDTADITPVSNSHPDFPGPLGSSWKWKPLHVGHRQTPGYVSDLSLFQSSAGFSQTILPCTHLNTFDRLILLKISQSHLILVRISQLIYWLSYTEHRAHIFKAGFHQCWTLKPFHKKTASRKDLYT